MTRSTYFGGFLSIASALLESRMVLLSAKFHQYQPSRFTFKPDRRKLQTNIGLDKIAETKTQCQQLHESFAESCCFGRLIFKHRVLAKAALGMDIKATMQRFVVSLRHCY